jgi:hypothetical protein
MMMTIEQRMAQLEARFAQLENRIANLEARNMTYGPLPTIPPTNPWPNQPWTPNPYGPPYTVTCKLADGTTREMTFTTPIVAQTNE